MSFPQFSGGATTSGRSRSAISGVPGLWRIPLAAPFPPTSRPRSRRVGLASIAAVSACLGVLAGGVAQASAADVNPSAAPAPALVADEAVPVPEAVPAPPPTFTWHRVRTRRCWWRTPVPPEAEKPVPPEEPEPPVVTPPKPPVPEPPASPDPEPAPGPPDPAPAPQPPDPAPAPEPPATTPDPEVPAVPAPPPPEPLIP